MITSSSVLEGLILAWLKWRNGVHYIKTYDLGKTHCWALSKTLCHEMCFVSSNNPVCPSFQFVNEERLDRLHVRRGLFILDVSLLPKTV